MGRCSSSLPVRPAGAGWRGGLAQERNEGKRANSWHHSKADPGSSLLWRGAQLDHPRSGFSYMRWPIHRPARANAADAVM